MLTFTEPLEIGGPSTIIIKTSTNNFLSSYLIKNECTKQLEYSCVQGDIPFKICCALLFLKAINGMYSLF